MTPAFCNNALAETYSCFTPECLVYPTTTITIPAANPTCSPTTTMTNYLPCCDSTCPTSTCTITGEYTCEPKTGIEFGTAETSRWITTTITAAPSPTGRLNARQDGCYTEYLGDGGFAPTVVCPPVESVCAVCIGCGAPVTICE